MVCLDRRLRCILLMSNDVRAERAFEVLAVPVLGPTGPPWRWEYPRASN
jgi:hypothetical protein